MKPIYRLFIFIAFLLLVLDTFGQSKQYPFDVKQTGKGKDAIIFIPGFTCAGDEWNDTRAQYESNHTCYTLTMAGFAGVPAQGNPSFKEREAAIAAFIKDKKINKPIIVGHSMGGGWAMAIAADYPALVSKIVVVDALPCLAVVYNPDFKVKENNDCSPMISKVSGMNDEDFFKMQKINLRQLVADTSKLDMLATWSVKSDRHTFGQMFCDFMNTDQRASIAAVQCPALILLEPSFETMKAGIAQQYAGMKTADIRYATKGLHFIMYDDAAWFDKQLSSFIQ